MDPLFHMCPASAAMHRADCVSAYSDLIRDALLCPPVYKQAADFPNERFGQFGCVVQGPTLTRAESESVGVTDVVYRRRVLQVAEAGIAFDSVDVVDLLPWWARTEERTRYEYVDAVRRPLPIAAQLRAQISLAVGVRRHYATDVGPFPWLGSSHTSVIADFVPAFPSDHRFPPLSHAARDAERMAA